MLDRQHPDVRPPRGEPRRELGDRAGGHVRGDAQPEGAGLAGADPRHDALELLDALDDATRLVEQQRAGGRQLDAPRGADEQLDAQRGLERLDALAERRLRDVQARGGAAEVQLLGDGDEVAQVAQQVHRRPIMTQPG
jgi:hypothetical protein